MSTRKETMLELVQKVINTNLMNAQVKWQFCNGRVGDFKYVENDVVKVIFEDESGNCEVLRKENSNPVFCRNKEGIVYRVHGEFGRIEGELRKLILE